ncbi:hypothetical protein [Legionella brunensis]|uniref:Uncharacterized protein n=1 Tax=Legionella brunensis TaxID=29422 RepID=A0A0W0S1V5_9GAMM|nr:hypothetical protein [Legionella brunensis]KTC77085.1 hypothetical protein Lbru_3192 [Legionella brunensis]
MNHHYTAKIYSDCEEMAQKTGNDIEELYVWMLTYDNGGGCGTHGEIIDNITQEIVRKFKKSPIE